MSLPSNKPSGNYYRKRKAEDIAVKGSLTGSLDKFLVVSNPKLNKTSTDSSDDGDVDDIAEPNSEENCELPLLTDDSVTPVEISNSQSQSTLISETTNQLQANEQNKTTGEEEIANTYNQDIGMWVDPITDNLRTMIVKYGPHRVELSRFPYNESRRHFTTANYKTVLPNGVQADQRWLVYSKSKDSAFCFPCRIFGQLRTRISKSGYSDWKHLSRELREHEVSKSHLCNMQKWLDMENRLKTDKTIDAENQKIINLEVERWNQIFLRLFSIAQFLAERNLAFRGSEDTLFASNNGHFLGLVEFLAKFDPVMQEHVRRASSREIADHYLGKSIQNELIHIMATATRRRILDDCKVSKYFSVILDCTRDLSRREQMTIIIRFVDTTSGSVRIREHFLDFVEVQQTTGENLAEVLLQKLRELDLDLDDCRGQGYDNGSNMKGKNQGVQKRILDLNPRAFFVPCAAHNLNLVLADSVNATTTGFSFFGYMAKVYAFFSALTLRWTVLKKFVPEFTLKPLSETRWEARIESVKAIRFQCFEVYSALIELSVSLDDSKYRFEAEALANYMTNFEFLLSVVIWYSILFRINLLSKKLQDISLEFDSSIEEIDKVKSFLLQFRNTGFQESWNGATELASELGIEAKLPEVRVCIRKRQFDYEDQDTPIRDPKSKFEAEFFNIVLDQAIQSVEERFDQLKAHNKNFAFLYNRESLNKYSDAELMRHCKDLQLSLESNESPKSSDIRATELYEELKVFRGIVSKKTSASALASLEFILANNYVECFPNLVIALRILLTIPVTVASGERSFSVLKLIKTYLRTTMEQNRLSDLGILSIESQVTCSIDFKEFILDFANKKARKVNL